MKKAQGLSMTTIVVAAIAILVLIVIIVIFSGRMQMFNSDLESSAGSQTCNNVVPYEDDCDHGVKFGNFDNVEPGEKCCNDPPPP